MPDINIFGMTRAELESEFSEHGFERYRAEQVFFWLYNRSETDFSAFTNLSKQLRADFARRYRITHPVLEQEQKSMDGTRKFLFRLEDERTIETVLIPSAITERGDADSQGEAETRRDAATRDEADTRSGRLTLCLSTQVGCPLDCRFCATASMKLKRNLTAGEIVGQYLATQALVDDRITNIVYMGMGEPMLNYMQVMKSVEIITDEKTCGVSSSHITISTAGLTDGIDRMSDEGRKVKLAISLHATTDRLREQLMPINRKYNLAALMSSVERYYTKTRRPVTFEYILFDGFNDTDADANRLVKLSRRIPSKVNIIPFHSIDTAYPAGLPLDLRPSAQERIEHFAAILRANSVIVMLRSSSGKDIDAACGQLAVKHLDTDG